MTTPLLKFARSFERLKLRLQAQPAGDVRLLQLVYYWPGLQQYMGIAGYHSYFDEFVSLLLDHITMKNLSDLLPIELKQLLEAIISLSRAESAQYGLDIDQEIIELVGIETARKFFYAGTVSDGLNCLCRALDIKFTTMELPKSDGQLPEIDRLKAAQSQLAAFDGRLVDPVAGIVREWEIAHEALSFEEANCLFVERSKHADLIRGRLRSLQGSAEYLHQGVKTDEVTFENQIKAPDDPLVGAVYGALEAVARFLGRSGVDGRTESRIRARFRITGSDHTFTGDSIGLSAALVAYTQLLQPQVLKHERFIACEAAFTGGVDASGYLQPVNKDTLKAKVERAFFSPVRFLVLPRSNLKAARESIAELEAIYPRRRLLLTGAGTLADVIENRNIIRAERVCTGRYVMRKAHTYGRLVKVQVPLLLILLYVLICITYPKAWIGFDWNPENVSMNEAHDKMRVLNSNGDNLWSIDFDCSPVRDLYSNICDLDLDGRNEVIYITRLRENVPCSTSALMTARTSDGEVLFIRNGNIIGEYPGDNSSTQYYQARHLYIFQPEGSPVIVTNFSSNNPARSHLKIWSSDGELLGWYIHSGHIYNIVAADINGDGEMEVLGIGINNRVGGSGLFILPTKGGFGVSPPYEDVTVDLSNVKPGNQSQYIHFPTSDVALADTVPYGGAARMVVLPAGQVRIDILIGSSSIDWRSYYLDSTQQIYKMIPSDGFWVRRQKYVEGGHLPPMDMQDFCRWELERVRYWSSDGWISAPPSKDIN